MKQKYNKILQDVELFLGHKILYSEIFIVKFFSRNRCSQTFNYRECRSQINKLNCRISELGLFYQMRTSAMRRVIVLKLFSFEYTAHQISVQCVRSCNRPVDDKRRKRDHGSQTALPAESRDIYSRREDGKSSVLNPSTRITSSSIPWQYSGRTRTSRRRRAAPRRCSGATIE